MNEAIEWMEKNRMAVADRKTTILVSCTPALRRQNNTELTTKIKGKIINESKSENILGVILSNDLTWKKHFFGEKEKPPDERTEGILTALAKRAGLFKIAAKYANGSKLRSLANGLFYSKLTYSLPLIAEVWMQHAYKDNSEMRRSTTKEEYNKLQILQNKVEKIIFAKNSDTHINEVKYTPTQTVLKANSIQSIHQMVAEAILNTFNKILLSKKPTRLYEQLSKHEGRSGTTWRLNYTPRLASTSSSLLEKGSLLWNLLDEKIKTSESHASFKKKVKIWTRQNIPVKPG